MPGFISGVPVDVGTDNCVAVAEGGNQTIVSVGMGVSVGSGVGVDGTRFTGRQATINSVIARRSGATTKQHLV
jgi:hypothetical protein